MWVAPKRLACSRLNSTGSTAMIRRAPATRAPWIALMPMPPTPSTATVSPGRTLRPVDRRAEAGGDAAGGERDRRPRDVGVDLDDRGLRQQLDLAERAELRVAGDRLVADPVRDAAVGVIPMLNSVAPRSHRYALFFRHDLHCPQDGTNDIATWSPGATLVTPGPTSSTSPAPSWPQMIG